MNTIEDFAKIIKLKRSNRNMIESNLSHINLAKL